MPRKKMKAVSKSKGKKVVKSKQQGKSGRLSLVESIEKDFLHVPAKLAGLYKKDLIQVKQQEKKLKADIKDAEAQKKTIQHKCTILSEKNTAAAKKQLAKAKKLLVNSNKLIATLTSELAKVEKHAHTLAQKQTKYSLLGKELIKLAKELDAKVTKAVAPKQRKKSAKKAKAAEFIEEAPAEEVITMMEDEEPVMSDSEEVIESEIE